MGNWGRWRCLTETFFSFPPSDELSHLLDGQLILSLTFQGLVSTSMLEDGSSECCLGCSPDQVDLSVTYLIFDGAQIDAAVRFHHKSHMLLKVLSNGVLISHLV